MKKKDAMKWINALRSGKYKQGDGELYNDKQNTYCCLGVLDTINPDLNLSNGTRYTLPRGFLIGLRSSGGGLYDTQTSLSDMNDDGYTFDEIADIIQIEYVEGFL